MYRDKQVLKTLVVSALLFFVVSCAGLTINPPGPEHQTLLVLPIKVTNKTPFRDHAFYYKYRIEKSDGGSEPLDAVIKLPAKEGFAIVDSLPPGRYAVTQFSYHPVGTGVSYSGSNTSRRNDRFILESGKITIFSHTLHVTKRNEIPGRFGETLYSFALELTSSMQEKEVKETLKAMPNIDAWKFM